MVLGKTNKGAANMEKMKIHFRDTLHLKWTACGIWSGPYSDTYDHKKVTCGNCKRTYEYKDAVKAAKNAPNPTTKRGRR